MCGAADLSLYLLKLIKNLKEIDGPSSMARYSHLIDSLDLFLRYIEPAYLERAMCVVNYLVTGKQRMIVDGKLMHLGSDTEEMLSIIRGPRSEGRRTRAQ